MPLRTGVLSANVHEDKSFRDSRGAGIFISYPSPFQAVFEYDLHHLEPIINFYTRNPKQNALSRDERVEL